MGTRSSQGELPKRELEPIRGADPRAPDPSGADPG
jgi:hypothetical protein